MVEELVYFAENIEIGWVRFFEVSSGLGSIDTVCMYVPEIMLSDESNNSFSLKLNWMVLTLTCMFANVLRPLKPSLFRLLPSTLAKAQQMPLV